jgi:IS30 family transposase
MTAREWANEYLGGYVKMELDERREKVKELANEGMSTRQIGDVVGVTHTTVERDLSSGTNEPKTNGQELSSGTNEPKTKKQKALEAKRDVELREEKRATSYLKFEDGWLASSMPASKWRASRWGSST